jgi:anti-anti-sigma regulatory factor
MENARLYAEAMFTPLIPITDQSMPLIGTLDRARAEQVLESALSGFSAAAPGS